MQTWYYANVGQPRQGPVTAEQIKALFLQHQVSVETLVWRQGMADWMPLGAVSTELGVHLPPPPPGSHSNPYAQPAAAVMHADALPPIPTHLVWGILSTLLCCWPLGVVSIVYATRVEPRRIAGDLAGARAASRAAGLWALWSCLSLVLIGAIAVVMAIVTEATSG